MRELKRDTSPLSMVYLPLGKRIREKVGEGDRWTNLPPDTAADGLRVLNLANRKVSFRR